MDETPQSQQDLSKVFNGSVFSVLSGRVRRPSGDWAEIDAVTHRGGVAVIPLMAEEVILIRQFRPVIGEWLIEIPAGMLDSPDEDPRRRAEAELAEEIGYRAGRLDEVAVFYTSPGYSDERLRLFLAREMDFIGENPEASEDIEIIRVPLSDIRRMLEESQFQDAKTIIGLQMLLAKMDNKQDD